MFDSSARHGLLSRTQNLADPKSRTPAQVQADHAKGVLQGGHGAAFVVYPTQGTLEAFSELKIDVTVYSDMWGAYTDNLLCKVRCIFYWFIVQFDFILLCFKNWQ